MGLLDRYLIKEYFTYFFLLWVGLTVLFLGIDFITNLGNFNWPVSKIVTYYVYKMPPMLQLLLPVAILLATLIVLSMLSKQNEILALYSSGVSLLKIASTLIATVAIICSFCFLFLDTFTPLFAKKRILLEKNLDPSQEFLISGGGRYGFWYRSGQLIYNVGSYIAEQKKLEDLSVFFLSNDFQLVETIHAKSAQFNGKEWELKDGFVLTYPFENNFPVSKKFELKTGVIPEKPSDLHSMKVVEELMKLKDLRHYIERNSSYGLDTREQQISYHERISSIFTPLIFVLLAILFAVNPLKTQSVAKGIAFCFIVAVSYLLIFRLSVSVGKSGHLPPLLAAWLANLIFLGYSSVMLVKKYR
jgi:lipopolysaccharide export system permease protein